jgi:hypothetical protein
MMLLDDGSLITNPIFSGGIFRKPLHDTRGLFWPLIGGAQEDSDCMLAPHWQKIYEDKALDMLGRLLSK